MKCAKAQRHIRLQPDAPGSDPQLLEHIQACTRCRLYHQSHQDLHKGLDHAAEPVRAAKLPPEFNARLRAALADAAAADGNRPILTVRRFLLLPPWGILSSQLRNAVAITLLAALIATATCLPQRPQASPHSPCTTHLSALSVQTAPGGRVLASVDSCSVTLPSHCRRIQ